MEIQWDLTHKAQNISRLILNEIIVHKVQYKMSEIMENAKHNNTNFSRLNSAHTTHPNASNWDHIKYTQRAMCGN